jgi:hypothetical protein
MHFLKLLAGWTGQCTSEQQQRIDLANNLAFGALIILSMFLVIVLWRVSKINSPIKERVIFTILAIINAVIIIPTVALAIKLIMGPSFC